MEFPIFSSCVHVHFVVCFTICIPCEYTNVYSRIIQYTDTVHFTVHLLCSTVVYSTVPDTLTLQMVLVYWINPFIAMEMYSSEQCTLYSTVLTVLH